jgi:hypothetical protein
MLRSNFASWARTRAFIVPAYSYAGSMKLSATNCLLKQLHSVFSDNVPSFVWILPCGWRSRKISFLNCAWNVFEDLSSMDGDIDRYILIGKSYDGNQNHLTRDHVEGTLRCLLKVWCTLTGTKPNSVAFVRERTIPTARPPLFGEVNASFCESRVSRGQRNKSPQTYSRISRPEPLIFLPSSSSVVLTKLSGLRSRPTTSQKIW